MALWYCHKCNGLVTSEHGVGQMCAICSSQVEHAQIEPIPTRYSFILEKITIDIELRNVKDNLWTISTGVGVVNNNNELEYDPMPSNRSDDFRKRTFFPLQDAIQRAKLFINSKCSS